MNRKLVIVPKVATPRKAGRVVLNRSYSVQNGVVNIQQTAVAKAN